MSTSFQPLTKDRIVTLIAAIVTALEEAGTGCPESTIYLICDSDIHVSNRITDMMKAADLITIKNYWCELTTKGHQVAQSCNAVLEREQAKSIKVKR